MKLFSTSSLLIPIALRTITIKVVPKINLVFFCEILLKILVIFESPSFFMISVLLVTKFKVAGNNVNVTVKEVIRPSVIIHPKSMMGLISLKIRDKKAQIVVKTV